MAMRDKIEHAIQNQPLKTSRQSSAGTAVRTAR